MALDTHRKALRGGLPWLVAALVLLGAAVALSSCVAPFVEAETLATWNARVSTALGCFGSAAMLFGALQLARAKSGGRSSFALIAFFPLWLVEFVLRLYSLAPLALDDGDLVLALRVVAASLAMLALSSGMGWVFMRQQARAQAAPWRASRTLFLAFVLALAAAWGLARWRAPEDGLWTWVTSLPFGTAIAWIAFLLPWLALVHALRRSVRFVARRQSVAEILTG